MTKEYRSWKQKEERMKVLKEIQKEQEWSNCEFVSKITFKLLREKGYQSLARRYGMKKYMVKEFIYENYFIENDIEYVDKYVSPKVSVKKMSDIFYDSDKFMEILDKEVRLDGQDRIEFICNLTHEKMQLIGYPYMNRPISNLRVRYIKYFNLSKGVF